ncbi:MAG: YegP family protein [Flavobacteriales bacterium]
MGKFVISKSSNGEFQFALKAGNGRTILSSEGYASRTGCDNGIESVRKNAPDDSMYERKAASDGSPYFTLKAANGQVIGISEMYESSSARDNGIESVKLNAPEAQVSEEIS